MLLRLPNDQLELLKEALRRAGSMEIGGQIFGEQRALSDFVASHLTFQKQRGTFARFIVDLVQAAKDAMRFFNLTSHSYDRFNYIGEWHSHPSFAVTPSGVDAATMRELVRAPSFRGSFAVLMIVRLDDNTLTCGAWLFDPRGNEMAVTLEVEP